ncbi:MAG: ATP-binding protein [Caldilineaceae bacterium]|nr:ATP-binding protein [Caldilineaceae bacterium]
MIHTAPLPHLLEHEAPWLARVRLCAQRRAHWLRTLWAGETLGLDAMPAVSPAEIDRILADPLVIAAAERAFYVTDPLAQELAEFIAAADARTGQDPAWTALCRAFDLTPPEQDLLALAAAVEVDPWLRRVYGYLHDDIGADRPTPWLAAHLFQWPAAPGSGPAIGPESALPRWRLAYPLEGMGYPWAVTTPWAADGAVVAWLSQGRALYAALGDGVMRLERGSVQGLPALYPDLQPAIAAFLSALGVTPENAAAAHTPAIAVELVGPRGAGKRILAAQLAAELGADLLVVDAGQALGGLSGPPLIDQMRRVARAARLHGLLIYWQHLDGLDARAWDELPQSGLCFCGAHAPIPAALAGAVRRAFVLPPLTRSQRLSLWQHSTPQPPPMPIAGWRLTPGEIVQAAQVAPAGPEAVAEVCRQLLHQGQSELFAPLPCPYSWDDIVLTAAVREHLADLENQARLRWQVYEEWGFGRLVPLGKGISALFAGPSGTGKTMAAQVLARSLGMELYRVDLAGVMNKYIGETEKRLKQVFDACERANVLLFFDEADALFGQRMQVKDAHDRFANIEIDYLLQRMEQFDGIAILATNRKGDLDKAFLRRLRFIVDFLPPSPAERLTLWRLALPAATPAGQPLLDTIDWNFLATKLTMTGADIKAAALGAAFLARAAGTRISMAHILSAARRELTKHGVVVRAGEWEEGSRQ